MYIERNICEKLEVENPLSLTPDQFYRLIKDAIEYEMPVLVKEGEETEVFSSLDYGQASTLASRDWSKLSDIPDIEQATVRAVPHIGGNEGVYVDVSLVVREYGRSDREYPLFIFKTLGEGFEANCMMGALAGAITYAVELFFMVNIW